MTVVPLPDTPCVRVRLVYNQSDGFEGGNRFYLSYSGSAPTAANCATLAADVEAAWVANCAAVINEDWALVEVDVLDIATDSGLSGQWSGSESGTVSGTPLPAQCATGIEYDIARRYRGGKPRIYLPPPTQTQLLNPSTYTSGFQSTAGGVVADFFAAIEADTVGSMGTLDHVNLSYYKGFTNITNSSGRERAVPTYRATALHDAVEGYAAKARISSQRRRRSATTP